MQTSVEDVSLFLYFETDEHVTFLTYCHIPWRVPSRGLLSDAWPLNSKRSSDLSPWSIFNVVFIDRVMQIASGSLSEHRTWIKAFPLFILAVSQMMLRSQPERSLSSQRELLGVVEGGRSFVSAALTRRGAVCYIRMIPFMASVNLCLSPSCRESV